MPLSHRKIEDLSGIICYSVTKKSKKIDFSDGGLERNCFDETKMIRQVILWLKAYQIGQELV